MADNQYDDSDKGGYSYEEKLDLVSQGLMDPTEIGLPPDKEGQAQAQAQIPQEPKIGDFITFECSEVPIGLRAHWARQELKIQPPNPRGFEADWIEEHSKEHLLQARARTGNQQAVLQRLVTEPVLGMVILMREAADIIEKKYADLQNQSTVSQGSTETVDTKDE